MSQIWLSGLLHQVVDNESSVAQQATKFVVEEIFEGLTKANATRTWELMDLVERNSEYTCVFFFVVFHIVCSIFII